MASSLYPTAPTAEDLFGPHKLSWDKNAKVVRWGHVWVARDDKTDRGVLRKRAYTDSLK